MRLYLLSMLAFLLAACNHNNENSAPIPISNSSFFGEVGIYVLQGDAFSLEDFKMEAKKQLPEFVATDSFPNQITFDGYQISYFQDPATEYTPFDTSYLKHSGVGLSPEEELQLQKASKAYSIAFFGLTENVVQKQKKIAEFIYSMTVNRKMLITDYSSFECFNPGSWKKNRIENLDPLNPNLVNQISIHLYRTGGYCRGVSMGMNKFSLPDISIDDFSCRDSRSFSNLMNALVQHFIENPFIESDSTLTLRLEMIRNATVKENLLKDIYENGKRTVKVRLRSVVPSEGDNQNSQWKLVFEDEEFSSPQEEQKWTISTLFGSKDSVTYINHDSLLLKTSEEAKKKLPSLKKMFDKELAPGYSILVKGPFETDSEGREWMWVEITKWENGLITGILQNDPSDIANLKAGAIVKVKEKEVFDYILNKPDGSTEGNETGKVIEQQQQ